MPITYLEMKPVMGAGTIDFYRERQAIEALLTIKVLDALPADHLEFTPHPLSQNARTICETMIRCLRVSRDLAASNHAEMSFDAPLTKQQIVDGFRALSEELKLELASKDQGFWQENALVTVQGTPILEHTRAEILWLFLFDAIHHRGQLSTYLRPMGAKVPSIYGKSLDGTL